MSKEQKIQTDNKEPTFSFLVTEQYTGTRLDRFLAAVLEHEHISREKLKRAIKGGAVRIDGAVCATPKTKLQAATQVDLYLSPVSSEVMPEDGELAIVYRDAHCIVLNKQPGLTVHPCPSCPEGTLVHRLLHHFPELRALEGFRPGIVHRLDKDTSGLLIVALTEQARMTLAAEFADRNVHKEYLAIVKGVPQPAAGTVEAPIGRHPSIKVKMAVVKGGKEARSTYRTLYTDPAGEFSLVAVTIHTGRTHQIRVHMSHIGHPLWGDALYGGGVSKENPLFRYASRQMLHAWKLECMHPVSKKPLRFTCEPPEDFPALITALSRRLQRVVITGMPGCGKSALSAALAQNNIPVWSSDAAVHELYQPEADGWHVLRGRFGSRFVEDDGPVNRKALFAAMQQSEAIRKEVEAFIHPLVRQSLLDFWQTHRNAPVAVAEVPLFFEAGWLDDADLTIGVNTQAAVRAERLHAGRDWSDEMIATMDSWQWPEAQKMKACDLLIENNGSLEDLKHQATLLPATLAERRNTEIATRLEAITGLWRAQNNHNDQP